MTASSLTKDMGKLATFCNISHSLLTTVAALRYCGLKELALSKEALPKKAGLSPTARTDLKTNQTFVSNGQRD